jgi:predicted small metal-binding protein
MYEFQCGSPVCHSRFTAKDKEGLMRQVTEHVRKAHKVDMPPASIIDYLGATAVTEVATARGVG